MAQAAPSVSLACPTPTATGVRQDISTQTGLWTELRPGDPGQYSANTATNGGWVSDLAGAAWLGNGAYVLGGGDYTFILPILANDPNIDLNSVSITYAYRADDTMLSADLAGTPLAVDLTNATGTYNSASPATGGPTSTPLLAGRNELSVRIHNNGSGANPYGLIMQATLTYNCRIAPTAAATAVPVDAPWALAGMGALLAASVAMSKRRRKSA